MQYRDLEAFIWSLGPAAIGLILVWVAEWRLKRRPETDDKRIAVVSVGAYFTCWAVAVGCLALFVMLWVQLYFSSTSYLQGVVENVPFEFQTATMSNADDQIYYSDRTLRKARAQTFAWIVKRKAAPHARRVINLGFQNNGDVLFAEISLTDLANLGNLEEIRLRFDQEVQPNRDLKYVLRYDSDKRFALTPLDFNRYEPKAKDEPKVSDDLKANDIKKGELGPIAPRWWNSIITAFAQTFPAQTLPKSVWTTDQLIAGLDARSISARKNSIDELAGHLYDTPEYLDLANRILAARGDDANPTRRWSIYEAMRIAYQAKIRASKRDGILATADRFELALSDAAVQAIVRDALSGTASANDAAKWLLRFSPNRKLLEAVAAKTSAVSADNAQACYAAFAINVAYNWILNVPLSAKKSDYQWYAASEDLPIIDHLFEESTKLSAVTATNPEYTVAGTIAFFGMGLFYAEMSILAADRIHLSPGASVTQAKEEWAQKSKAMMKKFLDTIKRTPRWDELYRFPWHKGLARQIVEQPLTQQLLDGAGGDRTNNERIRDFVCISTSLRG